MKKLKMSLELSNLGDKTHIWFPLPQRSIGRPNEWINSTNFKVVTDKKFNNRSAYFLTSLSEFKISAIFPLSNNPDDMDNPEIFLKSNSLVQSDSPAIKNIANSLTAGSVDDNEKAKMCFDWVTGYL